MGIVMSKKVCALAGLVPRAAGAGGGLFAPLDGGRPTFPSMRFDKRYGFSPRVHGDRHAVDDRRNRTMRTSCWPPNSPTRLDTSPVKTFAMACVSPYFNPAHGLPLVGRCWRPFPAKTVHVFRRCYWVHAIASVNTGAEPRPSWSGPGRHIQVVPAGHRGEPRLRGMPVRIVMTIRAGRLVGQAAQVR